MLQHFQNHQKKHTFKSSLNEHFDEHIRAIHYKLMNFQITVFTDGFLLDNVTDLFMIYDFNDFYSYEFYFYGLRWKKVSRLSRAILRNSSLTLP